MARVSALAGPNEGAAPSPNRTFPLSAVAMSPGLFVTDFMLFTSLGAWMSGLGHFSAGKRFGHDLRIGRTLAFARHAYNQEYTIT
jgi:hypothetical protein